MQGPRRKSSGNRVEPRDLAAAAKYVEQTPSRKISPLQGANVDDECRSAFEKKINLNKPQVKY